MASTGPPQHTTTTGSEGPDKWPRPLVRWGTRERRAARWSVVAKCSGDRGALYRLGPRAQHVVEGTARIGAFRSALAPVPPPVLHGAKMRPTAHMWQVSTRTPIISSPAHASVCLFSPPLPRANASLRDRTSRAMLFCTCVPLAANILFQLELSVKRRLAVSHAVRTFVRDLYE